jgi:hypothetical protein
MDRSWNLHVGRRGNQRKYDDNEVFRNENGHDQLDVLALVKQWKIFFSAHCEMMNLMADHHELALKSVALSQ